MTAPSSTRAWEWILALGSITEDPPDGLPEPRFEALGRRPAELVARLASVDSVAKIVARAVLDEGDEALVRGPRGADLVDEAAEEADNIKVRSLVVPPQVVALARAAPPQRGEDALAVVLDIEPVADVGSVAVDGDRKAPLAGADDGGDELLV